MLIFLLGIVLAVIVITLGVAFGILLAKRLEGLSPETALRSVFWKPVRVILLGIAAFALAGYIYYHYVPTLPIP